MRRNSPAGGASELKRRMPLGQLGTLRVRPAQLGRASGEPGPRAGPRRFTFGAVSGDGRRGQLRALELLLPEHLLLALAFEQRQELLLLDRLTLDEDLRDLGQVLLMFGADVP